jgi:hypothetical protein
MMRKRTNPTKNVPLAKEEPLLKLLESSKQSYELPYIVTSFTSRLLSASQAIPAPLYHPRYKSSSNVSPSQPTHSFDIC